MEHTHKQLDAEHNCLQLTDAVVLLLTTTLLAAMRCQLVKVKRATGHTGQRAKVSSSNRAAMWLKQIKQSFGLLIILPAMMSCQQARLCAALMTDLGHAWQAQRVGREQGCKGEGEV